MHKHLKIVCLMPRRFLCLTFLHHPAKASQSICFHNLSVVARGLTDKHKTLLALHPITRDKHISSNHVGAGRPVEQYDIHYEDNIGGNYTRLFKANGPWTMSDQVHLWARSHDQTERRDTTCEPSSKRLTRSYIFPSSNKHQIVPQSSTSNIETREWHDYF